MIYHDDKIEITKTILAANPDLYENTLEFDKVLYKWWRTGRSGYGLRLSEDGYKAFKIAKLCEYEFITNFGALLARDLSFSWLTMEMNKKMKCPFFIRFNPTTDELEITIYDERIASLVNLYGGIKEYLASAAF